MGVDEEACYIYLFKTLDIQKVEIGQKRSIAELGLSF